MNENILNKNNFLLVIILIILLWFGLAFSIHHIFQDNMIGVDYMFYWHAGRVFFLEHDDIYSPAIGADNQLWVYGRPALPGEDDLNFAYPPYILFFPFPLFFLDYDWSQAFWMATNLTVLISLGLFFFPETPKWIPFTFLLFYPIYFTMIIGNTALLIGVLLIVALHHLLFQNGGQSPGTDIILGALLAFTTGKPQLVWFFIIFIFFICIVQKRWKPIASFLITFAAINVISFSIYPSWPIHWLQNTFKYSQEGGIAPTLVWYLSSFLSETQALAGYVVLFSLALPISGFLFWKWKRGDLSSICLITYVAFITNLFDPSSLTPDKIILLVPLFLWTVQNSSSRRVKIVWGLGILLTNLAFAVGKTTAFNLAVDMLPLLFYIPWMAYIFFDDYQRHRYSKLAGMPDI